MTSQTRLFVGRIPCKATEDNLRKSFSKFGNVLSCELKKKSSEADDQFAFITIATDHNNVESCIHHFSQSQWQGSQLHVTRARESFLERLQKERQQAQIKKNTEFEYKPQENYDEEFKIKSPQVSSFNIKKPGDKTINGYHNDVSKERKLKKFNTDDNNSLRVKKGNFGDEKKQKSDNKRLESMRKMRQQFNEKKLLIKSGLAGVDKGSNKKIKFEEEEEISTGQVENELQNGNATSLFDNDEEDDDNVNFNIKEQYEGKKGQKVLELQSRFKSDKRFVLDERFMEEEHKQMEEDETVEVANKDEKARQLSILQNVLGVEIRSVHIQPQLAQDNKKSKKKLGMLRFDPNQPEHAKFLAPKVDGDQTHKKKKTKRKEEQTQEPERIVEKVEVSKEQFYKVSDSLKEAIAKPNNFSLRSLFANDETHDDEKEKVQSTGYTPLTMAKKDRVKNPLDISSKNPFKYDSSDSEPEDEGKEELKPEQQNVEPENFNKAVWRENLFFSANDDRFKEGLAFFNSQVSRNKERRELKSLVKKRLYNRARKDTMFQKKIGGKRKNFSKNRHQKR